MDIIVGRSNILDNCWEIRWKTVETESDATLE